MIGERAFEDSVSFASVGVVRVSTGLDATVISNVKQVVRLRHSDNRAESDRFFDGILRRNRLRIEPTSLLFILRGDEKEPKLMKDAGMVEIVSGEIEAIMVGGMPNSIR